MCGHRDVDEDESAPVPFDKPAKLPNVDSCTGIVLFLADGTAHVGHYVQSKLGQEYSQSVIDGNYRALVARMKKEVADRGGAVSHAAVIGSTVNWGIVDFERELSGLRVSRIELAEGKTDVLVDSKTKSIETRPRSGKPGMTISYQTAANNLNLKM